MELPSRRALLLSALFFIVVAAGLVGAGAAIPQGKSNKHASACPSGYMRLSDAERSERAAGIRSTKEADAELAKSLCVSAKHPESLGELILRQEGLETVRSAPYDKVAPGAYANAVAQGKQMPKSGAVKGTEGAWQLYGKGPLIVNDPKYSSVNRLGLVDNSGRVDSIKYDAAHNRLFVALGTGGVWMSTDLGSNWTSIGDSLPSQVVGAVGWTEANGGTVLAVSGDPSYGSNGYTGYGAFYSTDLGATWSKATGIPDGALGFAIEADPANPAVVYAATLYGLFRSTDGGKTYANVNLPTGACAGIAGGTSGRPDCQLANVVTDVVVRAPGGVNQNVAPSTVVAAVGWRAGPRTNSDGTVQSAGNGIYRSSTGEAGTFTKVDTTVGFARQDRIGRIELGATTGSQQDHDYLYAIVQDAGSLNGQLDVLDVPITDPTNSIRPGTVLNGVYVSADFGQTWTLMADDNAIARNPATGSALVGYGQATGYEPGVQAWYNEWIAPDPTRQNADGIPTRLAFGLEEIWQNEASVPMNGPTSFKVIARYYAGDTCILLFQGLPDCPTNRSPSNNVTTTHPDQQDGLWVPDGSGGVTLTAGNDGGFYKNHVAGGEELNNGGWGNGNQAGFNTLLPYSVAAANDGTAWAGLQDNGHLKITPADGKQYETYGGDGTFAAVNPTNSDIAYEAYVFNAMKVTTDGGKTWAAIDPKITNTRFVNPFDMDPTDANHLVTAGREVVETVYGPDTVGPYDSGPTAWKKVFDLGTAQHPGDATATSSASDPALGMSAIDVYGDATYVAACGVCDILNASAPFKNAIATNVGGSQPAKRMTSQGWHFAAAKGLPSRFITSIAIHPKDVRTIYVTLGGYSRRWVPPGTLQDQNANVGEGHVFKSTDAGATFTDVSGNLPDVPATWVTLRGNQVIVGTDVGMFASDQKGGTTYASLTGLPNVPISMSTLKPNDCNTLFVATYGRGVWTYTFSQSNRSCTPTSVSGPPPPTGPPPATGGTTFAGPYGFELTDEGWTTSSTHVLTGWKRTAPGHNSGSSFQVTPYVDESTYKLASPLLTHPGGWVYLDFRNKRNSEPGFDFLNLEWSSDGINWNTVPWLWDPLGQQWRNDLSLSGKNTGYPGFDLEKGAFYAPAGNLYVRFRFTSDQLVSSPLYEGVWVDDVALSR